MNSELIIIRTKEAARKLCGEKLDVTSEALFTVALLFLQLYRERFGRGYHLLTLSRKVEDLRYISAHLDQEIQGLNVFIANVLDQLNIQEQPELFDMVIHNLKYLCAEGSAEDVFDAIVDSYQFELFGRDSVPITPAHICCLLSSLSRVRADEKVVDPYCRSGEVLTYLNRNIKESNLIDGVTFSFYSYVIASFRANLSFENLSLNYAKNWNLSPELSLNLYDVVLTNPKFGVISPIEKTNQSQINNFDTWFLDKSLRLLSTKGRATIVMSEGFLFRNSDFDERKKLVQEKWLKAVIQLPIDSFLPHAKVHTAIIVIDKSKPNDKVCFANLSNYSREELVEATKNILELIEGKEVNININFVSVEDIVKENYALKPSMYVIEKHINILRKPDVILKDLNLKRQQLKLLQKGISKTIADMKGKVE
jgi:hypothetical protein